MSHPKNPSFTTRFFRTNALRGLAIASVLLFHTDKPVFKSGYLGVDLFFIISGFVMYQRYFSVEFNTFSFSKFYQARILRLAPTLLFIIFLFSIILRFLNLPTDTVNISHEAIFAVLGLSNLYFLHHSDYFSGLSSYDGFIHTWSLSLEEQFYLVFPIIIIFSRRRLRENLCMLFSILLFSCSLIWMYVMSKAHPGIAFYTLPGRIFEFQSGVFIAVALNRGFRIRNLLFVGTCVFLIFCTLIFGFSQGDLVAIFAIILGTSVILLFEFRSYPTLLKKLLLIFSHLGLSSYAIYLVHQPLFVVARLATTKHITNQTYFFLCGIAIFTGYLITKFLESPIRKSKNKNRAVKLIAICLIFVVFEQLLFIRVASDERNANPLISRHSAELMKRQYKWGLCFTKLNESSARQIDRCLSSSPISSGGIYVWGDSHAASVGSGMSLVNNHVSFISHTSCPPLISNVVRVDCRVANVETLRAIQKYHPKILVLAADWQTHKDSIVELAKSIKFIKQMLSGTRIVLLGPLPRWSPSLDQQLMRLHISPSRRIDLVVSNVPEMAATDDLIMHTAENLRINYILPSKLACHNYVCPAILISKGSATPSAYDDAHLTETGSEFYALKILKQIKELK